MTQLAVCSSMTSIGVISVDGARKCLLVDHSSLPIKVIKHLLHCGVLAHFLVKVLKGLLRALSCIKGCLIELPAHCKSLLLLKLQFKQSFSPLLLYSVLDDVFKLGTINSLRLPLEDLLSVVGVFLEHRENAD